MGCTNVKLLQCLVDPKSGMIHRPIHSRHIGNMLIYKSWFNHFIPTYRLAYPPLHITSTKFLPTPESQITWVFSLHDIVRSWLPLHLPMPASPITWQFYFSPRSKASHQMTFWPITPSWVGKASVNVSPHYIKTLLHLCRPQLLWKIVMKYILYILYVVKNTI